MQVVRYSISDASSLRPYVGGWTSRSPPNVIDAKVGSARHRGAVAGRTWYDAMSGGLAVDLPTRERLRALRAHGRGLVAIHGARTWCGHGVFAHNLVKIGALAA